MRKRSGVIVGCLQYAENKKMSRAACLQGLRSSIEINKGFLSFWQGLGRLGEARRGLNKCHGDFVEG